MKRMILATLSVATFATSAAFAQNENLAIENEAIYEQEDGAIASPEIEQMVQQGVVDYAADPGQIIGGIIGGIIGAIGSDRWDRENPRPNRFVTCFAKDRRGQLYRATARRARAAQNLALNKCYDNARYCRPAGCR